MQISNEPPDSGDHDKLIDMGARLRKVEGEVDNLRDWRHNQITPVVTVIQAQQKTNADHIGRLAASVETIALSQAAISHLPGDLRDHRNEDREEFRKVDTSLDALHDKLDQSTTDRASAHKALIYWVAGLMIAGLAAVVGLQWAFVLPHLPWH